MSKKVKERTSKRVVKKVCPKCNDKGYTEENNGFTMIKCDCEAGERFGSATFRTT